MNIKNSLFSSFEGFKINNSGRIMGGDTGTKDDGTNPTSQQGCCDTQTNDTPNETIVGTNCDQSKDGGTFGVDYGGNNDATISDVDFALVSLV